MKSKSKKKEEQRRKRRLFLAIIMILFVGVVLTTSTYAWFTANRTVTVDSIDVTVTTSEGLQISTDAIDWKSIITNDDITGASTTYSTAVNQLPTGTNLLSPVSTIGAIDGNGFMQMYRGAVKENAATGTNILTAEKSTETNGTAGDFVAFDLFFQSTVEQDVYLTSESKVTVTTGKDSTGIENAARVAFIREGNVAYDASAASAQTLKVTSGNPAFIWEPNFDVHTSTAIISARTIYNQTLSASGGSQVSYMGVKAEIPESAAVALDSSSGTYFGSVTPSPTGSKAEGIPSTAYLNVFKVSAGITKIRVYMWIEGQDVDCEDHASGGSISYNLQFSIDSARPSGA